MAKRGVRNNTLTVALISAPLGLVQAKDKEANGTGLRLCTAEGKPVTQRYLEPASGELFTQAQLARGVSVGKDPETGADRLHVVPREALEQIEGAHKVETMEILEFVARERVPFERVCDQHLVQGQEGQPTKPLALLYEALRRTGKAAIVKMSVGKRQRLAAVLVTDAGPMVCLRLRFDAEMKQADEDVTAVVDATAELPEAEVAMAVQLVEQLSGDGEAIYTAQDEMVPEREELIRRVLDGEEIAAEEVTAAAPATPDISAALEASLAAVKKPKGKKR